MTVSNRIGFSSVFQIRIINACQKVPDPVLDPTLKIYSFSKPMIIDFKDLFMGFQS
jgi:hypothetical protein